jgi:hypothetical protein
MNSIKGKHQKNGQRNPDYDRKNEGRDPWAHGSPPNFPIPSSLRAAGEAIQLRQSRQASTLELDCRVAFGSSQ